MIKKFYIQFLWQRFWQSYLNRIALVLVTTLMLLAWLAPLFANNKPYFYRDGAELKFPAWADLFPLNHFLSYPELNDVDFRVLKKTQDATLILPPIPYSPTEYDLDSTLVSPRPAHIMGTDEQGRDIAARMIYGAQISLSVGFVAVGIYVVIGIILGALAGFLGGRVDILISRLIEIVMCFPTFFLILTVLAFIGNGLVNIMIVIGLTGWTGIARLVRGEFLRLRDQDFVVSTRALGLSRRRIIFRHILPNALSPVLVSITFGIASSILVESSLSFLGFGVQPPTPSWGEILSQSREFMDIAWWLMLFPGLAIFFTITAFNIIGEGVRDAVDARL